MKKIFLICLLIFMLITSISLTACLEVDDEELECQHEFVTVEGYEHSCTQDGLTDGKSCMYCGEILEAQEKIPARHTESVINGIPATCTQDGLTDGKKCSKCYTILEEQKKIDATGHNYSSSIICPDCQRGRVSSSAHLLELAEAVNSGNTFEGLTIFLENDIDLNGIEWTPIGIDFEQRTFKGTFEGGGHKISNFKITTARANNGLFGTSYYGEIKDLCVSNFEINYNSSALTYAGGLSAGAGKLLNCSSTNGKITVSTSSADAYVGGLIGHWGQAINCYSSCEINVSVINANAFVGGLTSKETNLDNSYASGNVNVSINCETSNDTMLKAYVGGLIGENYIIENCHATGNVSVTANSVGVEVGGLTGRSASVKNCYATGKAKTMGEPLYVYMGGLLGNQYYILDPIENCYSSGTVDCSTGSNASLYIGGFGGNVYSAKKCFSTGDVKVTANTSTTKNYLLTGGFAGYIEGIVSDCFSKSNITTVLGKDSNSYAGGFVAINDYRSTIENCYAIGNVHSTIESYIGYAGGFICSNGQNAVIRNCYATGNIYAKSTSGEPYARYFAVSSDYTGKIYNGFYSTSQTVTNVKGTSTTVESSSYYGTAESLINIKTVQFHKQTLSWSEDIWTFVEGEYPTLKQSA